MSVSISQQRNGQSFCRRYPPILLSSTSLVVLAPQTYSLQYTRDIIHQCPQYLYRSQHNTSNIISHLNSLLLNNSSQFQASKAGLCKVYGLPTFFFYSQSCVTAVYNIYKTNTYNFSHTDHLSTLFSTQIHA